MRLIDADALDEALTALRFTADGELAHWGDRKDWCLHGSEIEMLIANAPTVEAEPVRNGHWIYCRDRYADHKQYQCSECGKHMWSKDKYLKGEKYCFNCGAKMKGEEE